MSGMRWYLHSCPACGGDMHDDPQDRGWVVCFMCARSFRLIDLENSGTMTLEEAGAPIAPPRLPLAA